MSMFLVDAPTVIASSATYEAYGRDRVMLELMRRYLTLTAETAPMVLDSILDMSAESELAADTPA